MERDLSSMKKSLVKSMNFNSHAHVERDLVRGSLIQLVKNFNSHAHVERDLLSSAFFFLPLNFNSHAHVERDTDTLIENLPAIIISTHTLTWSVTFVGTACLQYQQFQLTRSRGA